jgi:hypothetical protein
MCVHKKRGGKVSFWSNLFGSKKVIDGLMNSADVMWETTEEKSKAKMMFLKLYEPFKLAQRYALFIFTIPFISIHVLIAFSWLYAIFNTAGARYESVVRELHELANMNNLTLGEPVLWIVAFYFLGGAGEGMIKAAMNRFKAKK